MKNTKFYLIFLSFILSVSSCNKELNHDNLYFSKVEINNFAAKTEQFYSALIRDGLEAFQTRNELFQTKILGMKGDSKNEVILIYAESFQLDLVFVENYFDYLVLNNDFISKSNTKSLLIDGLIQTTRSQKEQTIINLNSLEERGVFTSIAIFFNAGCSIQVATRIADSAVSAAVALSTAPTGVGLAIGLANSAVEYGLAIKTALNCN